MFGQDHVALLREDEFLHGASFVRGTSRLGGRVLMIVNFDRYEESERKGRFAGYRILEHSL